MSSKNIDEGGWKKSPEESSSKRRRGLGAVTANACTECRKKRAKCDGQVPCGRCSSQMEVNCVYEVPMRESKADMRSEIDSLRAQKRQVERLMAALVSTDQPEHIVSQLRTGATIESIIEQLDTGTGPLTSPAESHHARTGSEELSLGAKTNVLQPAKDVMDIGDTVKVSLGSKDVVALKDRPAGVSSGQLWPNSTAITHAPPNDSSSHLQDSPIRIPENIPIGQHGFALVGTWHRAIESYSPPDSPTLQARSDGQNLMLGLPADFPGLHGEIKPTNWTTVTDDTAFVEHLMALYFCWEYPTFASLNKEHFLADYKSGSQRYCSPLLVNAILAVGCRFSNQPQARTDPADSTTAGDHFFMEACNLLDEVLDKRNMTVVQALGLMSIREASCGRSSGALFYSGQSIRVASEMGLHLEPEKENLNTSEEEKAKKCVQAATFWGAFALDQAWSLSIGRLPHFSRDLNLVSKPAIIDHIESSHWVPYTDDGAPLQVSYIQPSNVRTIYRTFSELSEIVHRSLYTLYTPGTTLTGKALSARYKDLLDFHARLPRVVKLGENFTPAVIFVNMYFHYAMLLLFRPFIKLKIQGVGQISPRDICDQAAEAVTKIVKSYSQLYTLRRTPSFVPYFVLASTITHVVSFGTLGGGEKSREPCQQGFDSLTEMAKGHAFASEAMKILEYLVHHWKVPLSFNSELEQTEDYRLLCRPESTSMNQFCPNIDSVDIVNSIGKISRDENPLFWPFPLQGRPLMSVGPMLESLGFFILPEYQPEKEKDESHLTEMEVDRKDGGEH